MFSHQEKVRLHGLGGNNGGHSRRPYEVGWNPEALNLKVIQVSWVMGGEGNNAPFAFPMLDIWLELKGQFLQVE